MDAAPPPSRRPLDREAVFLYALFALTLVFALVQLGTGWKYSILDRHGFRQTQTAMTAYALLHGGPWLAYETPVLGPPWAIPIEFPLYQWSVALTSGALHMPLDQSGRLVSVLYFLLCLPCVWIVLAALGVARRFRTIFLDLILVSPIYIFWSRTFMIESTALFFSLAYLACVAWYVEREHVGLLLVGALAGTLAALVKVTTFGSFGLAAAIILVHRLHVRRAFSDWRLLRRQWAPALAFAVVPLAILTRWIHFADELKERNPLAAGLITTDALQKWNFGTLAQRLDPATWRTLYDVQVGHILVRPVAWLAFGLMLATRRHVGRMAGAFVVFLSGYATFTNLYVIHDYYGYANALFLLAACAWGFVGLLEQQTTRWLGPILVAVVVLVCAYAYGVHPYHADQATDHARSTKFATAVRDATKPDDVLLVYGVDWSPEIPYLAERRAVMDREARPLTDPKIRASLAQLPDGIAAMVVCGDLSRNLAFIQERVSALHLAARPGIAFARCEAYLRSTD